MRAWEAAILEDTKAIFVSREDWEWFREEMMSVLCVFPEYVQEGMAIRLKTYEDHVSEAREASHLMFRGIPVIANDALPDGSFVCIQRDRP